MKKVRKDLSLTPVIKIIKSILAIILIFSIAVGSFYIHTDVLTSNAAKKLSLQIKKTKYVVKKSNKGKNKSTQKIQVKNLKKGNIVKWISSNKKIALVSSPKKNGKAKLTVYTKRTGRAKISAVIKNKRTKKVLKRLTKTITISAGQKPPISTVRPLIPSTTPAPKLAPEATPEVTPEITPNAGSFDHMSVINELCKADNGGRVAGTRGNALAASYITEHYRKYGLMPLLKPDYEWSYKENPNNDRNITGNIVGCLKGKDRTKAIIISAHYDTVAQAPGAVDNASGIAALLEIAFKLSARTEQPKTDIIFCAFNEEERMPLYLGSKAFVKEFTGLYDNVCNINIDCVGMRNGGSYMLGQNNNKISNELIGAFQNILKEMKIDYNETSNDIVRSDHLSFLAADIPAVCFTQASISSVIHSRLDVVGNIVPEQIEQLSSAIISFVTESDFNEFSLDIHDILR